MSKHNSHEQDKYIIGGIVVALALVGLLSVWLTSTNPGRPTETTPVASSTITSATNTASSTNSASTPGDPKTVSLAQCLAAKKITMYGADWCVHCQDQKRAFGSAWQYVPYVECPDNVQLCISKLVQSYPTWKKPDGTTLLGFNELPKLAEWAGCKF